MTKTTHATAPVDRIAAARAVRAAKKAEQPPAELKIDSTASTPTIKGHEEPAPKPTPPTTMEKAAITAEAARAKKIAALRAAKIVGVDPQTDPRVKVRVTKKGHGQVSMGDHIGGLGDLTYDHNEEPSLPQSIALQLEDRGFVEIQ